MKLADAQTFFQPMQSRVEIGQPVLERLQIKRQYIQTLPRLRERMLDHQPNHNCRQAETDGDCDQNVFQDVSHHALANKSAAAAAAEGSFGAFLPT